MPHREPTIRSRELGEGLRQAMQEAVTISEFEVTVVPGLLQIGEYARAVISRVVNVPPDEVDDRVAARLARQSLFSRHRPPSFTFYLHESALRTPVGGPTVMADSCATYTGCRPAPT